MQSANALFTLAGFLSLLAFLVMDPLSQHISDRNIALLSLVLGASGFACLLPAWHSGGDDGTLLSPSRFLTGFLLVSTAFPVGKASVVSLYTKMLPSSAQGVGQGVLLAVGAVSRIVGPFCAVLAVGSFWGMIGVFGGATLLFGGCALALVAMRGVIE